MPPQTLAAFNDHGTVEVRIDRDLDQAHELFATLPKFGIPLEALIAQLGARGRGDVHQVVRLLARGAGDQAAEMVA
jgi:hypothetical protein